jgi:hypothetical protein
MKTRALKNCLSSCGIEAFDIDWNSCDEVLALGKLVANQQIVFVNEKIPTETLYKTMIQWGEPSRALIHRLVVEKKLEGSHWREILLILGYVTNEWKDISDAVSMVSFRHDGKNRPKGAFANGELEWHSDQCAFDDAQRIIGLQSVSDTANSKTQFLCTHDAYESFSSDMRSTIKELICRHKWVDGAMAPDLDKMQTLMLKYNMVPIDGMETKLYRETATGLPGLKIPAKTFNGFVGMSMDESVRLMTEIEKTVYQDQYVYTQDWQDGQIVFMDQEITLHRRPTNVRDGDKRTMARAITYLNYLYPDQQPCMHVRYNGKLLTHDEFANIVDIDRLEKYNQQKHFNLAETV